MMVDSTHSILGILQVIFGTFIPSSTVQSGSQASLSQTSLSVSFFVLVVVVV